MTRDRVFRIGGIVSGIVLIAFGVVVIVLAIWGQNTVTDELKRQKITGTPDMTPSAIKESVEKAGLKNVTLPTCDVAGKPIDNGRRARCFSEYMNVHALVATGGFVYSEMGIYEAKPGTPKSQLAPGGGTNNTDEDQAARAERGPERLGDRDGAGDGAQRQLHGVRVVALQSRGRNRLAPRRGRVHRARARVDDAKRLEGGKNRSLMVH
jgi:hypothetical protein